MNAPIHFSVLGPIEAVRAGESLDLGSPKQRAVLALLLLRPNTPMSADQMIDALWGEHPPASATATLQAYISNLRKILEPERRRRGPASVLQKNGAGYQISVDEDQLDSLLFTRLISEAEALIDAEPERGLKLLGEALDLWRGPALADFRYDDFASAESLRLEELRLSAIEMRVGGELALGDTRGAIPDLESLVASHPLREKLWEYLMIALYRSGRQAEALRAFRRCEAVLQEVGITPGQRLRNLEQAILDQDPGLLRSEGPDRAPTRLEGLGALIGRSAERARFERCLEEARSGRASIVILEGEPGIGKTRLMEAFDEAARDSGVRTAFARCVEIGGTPPFWPWMQISRRLGDDLTTAAGQHARQLAPLLGNSLEGPPTSHLFHLAEGLGHALGELSKSGPVALLIDDLYSADPDSLHLLTLIAAEIQGHPIVLVVSHRGPDPRPAHPLNRFLADVSRFDRVHRLVIRPFSPSEIADLASSMSSVAIDDSVIQAIFERTEGNVFYTLEVLRLLLEDDQIDATPAGTLLPGSVLEVVTRRISGLSADALSFIRHAALFGRSFDSRIIAEILDLDRETTLRTLDEITATGLVTEATSPGVFRFSHMIVVDSVTQPLGALRRAQMHAEIADRLEMRPEEGPARSVEIAHHRVRSIPLVGRREAIGALSRAGEQAYLANAIELSEDLFTLRHQLVMEEPPSPTRDRMEIESLFDLGRVWTWNEGFHSPRLGEAARRLWELTGIVAGHIEFDLGSPITSQNPVLAAFQARFSVEIVSGDVDAAWKTTRRLLSLAASTPDPMIVYAANQTALTTLVHMGRVGEAREAAKAARSSLEVLNPRHDNSLMLPMGQQPAWLTYHSFAAWACWLDGAARSAGEEMREARVLCEAIKNPFVAGFCSTIEGIIAAMAGEPEKVIESQEWHASVSPDPIFGVVDEWLRLQRRWAEGMRGDDPSGAADDVEAMIQQLDRSSARVAHTLYWSLAAQLALRAGQPERALNMAEHGIDHSMSSGERFWYPELERITAEAFRLLNRADDRSKALGRARVAAERLGIAPLVERMSSLSIG